MKIRFIIKNYIDLIQNWKNSQLKDAYFVKVFFVHWWISLYKFWFLKKLQFIFLKCKIDKNL